MLDENIEAFVIYVNFLSLRSKMTIYPAWETQILLLLAKKVTVLAQYSNSADVFSKKLAKVLAKCTGISMYAIKQKDDKQPPYRAIYSLGLV